MAAYKETYDTTQPIETYNLGEYDFNGEYAKSYLLQYDQMKIGQTYRGYLDLKIAELVGKQQEMQDCIGDIADTVSAIIRNTGWDYAIPTVLTTTFENYMESGTFFNHHGFYLVCTPNSLREPGMPYTYSDIAFQIETIETSPKTEEFLRCAGEKYNRLKELENIRQSIINEAIAKYGEAEIRKIVTDLRVQKAPNSTYDSSDFFQRAVKHMEDIDNLSDKIRQVAHMFAARYHEEGINRLIYLMKTLENSSDPTQAIEYLNNFKRDSESITQDEIIEIIRWASALSNKARIWKGFFEKTFGKVGSILDQESYERVMREKAPCLYSYNKEREKRNNRFAQSINMNPLQIAYLNQLVKTIRSETGCDFVGGNLVKKGGYDVEDNQITFQTTKIDIDNISLTEMRSMFPNMELSDIIELMNFCRNSKRNVQSSNTESEPINTELAVEKIPEEYKQLVIRFLEAKHTKEEMNIICQLLKFLSSEPNINIVEWYKLVVLGVQKQPTEEEKNAFVALCMYANGGIDLYEAYSSRYVEQKTDGGKVKEKKADKS